MIGYLQEDIRKLYLATLRMRDNEYVNSLNKDLEELLIFIDNFRELTEDEKSFFHSRFVKHENFVPNMGFTPNDGTWVVEIIKAIIAALAATAMTNLTGGNPGSGSDVYRVKLEHSLWGSKDVLKVGTYVSVLKNGHVYSVIYNNHKMDYPMNNQKAFQKFHERYEDK